MRSEMRGGFNEQNRQMNALQRTVITGLAGLAIAIIGASLVSNSGLS